MDSVKDTEKITASAISESEPLQNELRRLREKLTEEQKSRQLLEKKYETLKQLLKRKDILAARLEKLSAVGQYVPEIIHKLKNPLMGISGYSELAEIAETKAEMDMQISKIQPQVQKLSNLLGQIRSMISHESEEFIPFNLNDNLTESFQVLELFSPKIFNLEQEFSEQTLTVNGDPFQIHQIHLNIAKIFFKTIKHDQNRVIKINTHYLTWDQLQTEKFSNGIQFQPASYWKKIGKSGDYFPTVSYTCDLIEITDSDVISVISDKQQPNGLDKQVQLSFDIVKDIVRRHLGNLIYSSNGYESKFYLVFPSVR